MFAHWLRRSSAFVPFAAALVVFLMISWATWQLARFPYDGLAWSSLSGAVTRIDPHGPAMGRLELGDRLVAIDGVPLWQARVYLDKQPGDPVAFTLVRGGAQRITAISLSTPPPAAALLRQSPLLLASVFWVLGVLVLAYKPEKSEGWLFFLTCQVSAVTLACGAVSAFGPLWTTQLFYVLLWWVGPLAVHLHMGFPVPVASLRTRWLPGLLYVPAVLGSLPGFVGDPAVLRSMLPALYVARQLWLAICLLAVVLLLVRAYRRAIGPVTRRQVGLVSLGGSMAIIPFFCLFLLPYTFVNQPFLPYEVAFLVMLVIPLTYGYAILSFRLIRLDRYVNRAATYTLLVALVSSLYLVLSTALAYLSPPVIWQQPTANIVTALLLGVTVGPLYRRLQILVTRLFYGGWYNYQSVVQQISQTLSDAAGDQELAQTLSQNLQTMMQLECVRLLLLDQCGSMHLTGVACTSCAGQQQVCLSTSSRIYRFFQGQSYPVISTTLHKALDGESLSDAEQQLLACAHDRLWIPLTTPDCLLGLGILGPKRGGGSFDANDLDILQVVARQASVALENSRLIVELKQRAAESEQLHKQILRAREEERKRVARDLHDQIIQSLVGLNYHLSDLRNRPPLEVDTRTAQLQLDVRRTLEDVRRICTDLRPPALDSLGLVAAVRSRLRELERQDGVQVSLTVEGNEKQPLPEDIALCVFRVLQEALSNVLKHAAARTVRVNLTILPGEIRLSVWDDGRGFRVPRHLGRLLDGHHFGLVGLRERLDAVDGVLKVTSSPGRGTRLQARVLLPPAAGVSDGREALLHG